MRNVFQFPISLTMQTVLQYIKYLNIRCPQGGSVTLSFMG